MALSDVCNEDMLVEFSNLTGPPDLTYTSDQGIDLVKVVPVLSTKCKANSKKIATNGVVIKWTVLTGGCAFTSATHTFAAGAGAVAVSTTKTKAESKFVLVKGDSGACVGAWVPPGGGTLACTCDVEISDAGQTKVRAQ